MTLLAVLEHIPDDAGFPRDELLTLVGTNGRLVISVPAHPRLFSDRDTVLGHERRYRRSDFLAILVESFDVQESGQLFSSLLAPRSLQVALEHMGRSGSKQGIGAWSHGERVTRSVTGVLQFDAWVGRWAAQHQLNIPGLSVWKVCRLAVTQGISY